MLNLKEVKRDRLNLLRDKYPLFTYESFSYKRQENGLTANFSFKIAPDIVFKPHLEIKGIDKSEIEKIDKDVIDNFIFHMGLAEIPSYWKTTCSGQIEIAAGSMTHEQLAWWKNLLIKGMGEFFFTNNIDFTGDNFLEIAAKNNTQSPKDISKHKNRSLILIGGGRDSVVTLELLKEANLGINALSLNPTQASKDIIASSKLMEPIIISREIDKNLLALNEQGYLNGHTPFSAYLAFLSVFCAAIFNYRFVIPSNERSSNEENVEYLASKINHQYSKSFEFEKEFRNYTKSYLSENIEYFSFLRPLYEIQISKIFANYNKYFSIFKSCNRGQKTNSWCCQCPKCLSIYISLSPFMEDVDLNKIFSQNPLQNKNLKTLLKEIVGIEGNKPFECVGTYNEILTGLFLSIKKYESEDSLPFLLKFAKDQIIPKYNMEKISQETMCSWEDQNFLPKNLALFLKEKSKC